MTWMKNQPEIFERMAADGLSLEAAMAHLQGLGFLYRHERDDSSIPVRMLRTTMPLLDDPDTAAAELVRLGYWRRDEMRFEVVEDSDVVRQSLAAQWAKREKDRRAQGRARSRKAESADASTDDAADESAATQASNQPTEQASREVEGQPLSATGTDNGRPALPRLDLSSASASARAEKKWTDSYDR